MKTSMETFPLEQRPEEARQKSNGPEGRENATQSQTKYLSPSRECAVVHSVQHDQGVKEISLFDVHFDVCFSRLAAQVLVKALWEGAW